MKPARSPIAGWAPLLSLAFGLVSCVLFAIIFVQNAAIGGLTDAHTELITVRILLHQGFQNAILDHGPNSPFSENLSLALIEQARYGLSLCRDKASKRHPVRGLFPQTLTEEISTLDQGLLSFGAMISANHPAEGESLRNSWETAVKLGFQNLDNSARRVDYILTESIRKNRQAYSLELGVSMAFAILIFILVTILAVRFEAAGRRSLKALVESEARLAREKEGLKVTLSSIGDAVISTDNQGKVLFMNPTAEALCAWKVEEAQSRPLSEVFRVVDAFSRVPRVDPVSKVLESGGIVELANHTKLLARDGREYSIADSGAPIRGADNQILGVVLVFRDVTEKEKTEQDRARNQKLDSLGVLAGGIAHDFNNLLAGIFGYIQLADGHIAKDRGDRARESLSKALKVYDRACDLTRQLLTFASGGGPKRKSRELEPIIRSTCDFTLSGSAVSVEYDFPEGLWPCECDENQLAQVITNLVINSIQAMSSGGRLEIRARNQGGEGDQGDRVIIELRDYGSGVSPQNAQRIFDPFFTTKESGHGLGLATARSILRRHDGDIELIPGPGPGALFRFWLPALANHAPVMGIAASPSQPSADTGTTKAKKAAAIRKILVMDDEDILREIIGEYLTLAGYAVSLTSEGNEAIRVFSDALGKEPFDACILDLTVPMGLGGEAAAKAMKVLKPDAILISTSGYAASTEGLGSFCAHVQKPFRKEALIECLRGQLGA